MKLPSWRHRRPTASAMFGPPGAFHHHNREAAMKSSRRNYFLKAALLASSLIGASLAQAEDSDPMQLPTGQFVTPTVLPGAIQQFLNPGLANYPNFVANEAVRSQLSPDGTTLLILCAGYNNNLDKNAHSDLAASNQ